MLQSMVNAGAWRIVIGAAALGAAPALAEQAVFPLDSAPASALRICTVGCAGVEDDDRVTLTVRGGGDPVSVTHFTPRGATPGDPQPVLGATVSAFGFGLEGTLLRGQDSERLSVGAAYELGPVTLGGGLSFEVETGETGAEGAASLGLDYALQPGVTVGGGLRLNEAGAAGAGGDVEAGFQMRLDF